MPIYRYKCVKCGNVKDLLLDLSAEAPACCDKSMERQLTSPSLITIKGEGGTRTYSKGYKEGYSQEYLKSIGKS